MYGIRNNVVLSIGCGTVEDAKMLGRGLCAMFELNGSCKNTRTVANKHGDMILSLRSITPMETVLEIAAQLHRMGYRKFDLAFRHKLTEEWSIFHGQKSETGPRLSGTDSGFVVTGRKDRKIRLLSKTTLSI